MFEELKLKFKLARMSVNQIVDGMDKMISTDERAEAPIKALIGLVVVAVLAGALIPVAINSLTSGRNTSWTTSELAMYGVISIMVLVAVVLLIVKIATE